jgi:hypothetical protein
LWYLFLPNVAQCLGIVAVMNSPTMLEKFAGISIALRRGMPRLCVTDQEARAKRVGVLLVLPSTALERYSWLTMSAIRFGE